MGTPALDPMRLVFLAAALLAVVPAAGAQSAPRSAVFAFTVGTSTNGATGRVVRGAEWRVGESVAVGVVQRSAASFSPRPPDGTTPFGNVPATYLETGASARASLRLGSRAEVAGSAGVAIASRFVSWSPFDAGVTAPLEVEATARVSPRVGLTASVSRSVPVTSVWAGYARAASDYSLSNRAVTLGLRVGL